MFSFINFDTLRHSNFHFNVDALDKKIDIFAKALIRYLGF